MRPVTRFCFLDPINTKMNTLLPCTCRLVARQPTSTSRAVAAVRPRRQLSSSTRTQYPRKARPTGLLSSGILEDDNPPPVEPWYTREVPHFEQRTAQPLQAPPPPSTVPPFLHPLWTHLFESPFLEQSTIKFIDERALESVGTAEGDDADRSVTSFVDWKIVASLRNGRERGIRGACDGVKIAVSVPQTAIVAVLTFPYR